MGKWMELIPVSVRERYELYNFNSAAEILSQTHDKIFWELMDTLNKFQVDLSDILEKGGNESKVPKKLSALLRPLDWKETEISGDLVVRLWKERQEKLPVESFS